MSPVLHHRRHGKYKHASTVACFMLLFVPLRNYGVCFGHVNEAGPPSFAIISQKLERPRKRVASRNAF